MAVTIKDVAKLAGVSISTVSRVINNSKPVSPEIRKKVLDVIKEIDYRPNDVARTLVTKKSYLIGVVVTDLGNSYVAEMVRGIEEIGKMYSYDILLCSTYGDEEAELNYLQLLNRKQVEGVIFISDILRDNVKEKLSEFNFPIVYLSRDSYEPDYETVTIDNKQASYEMTKYLISLGHKKIAYVYSEAHSESVDSLKLKGFEEAIEESEGVDSVIYVANDRSINSGDKIANEIKGLKGEVTAIFCSSDELAIGIRNHFYDEGIDVPEEFSIAGFGDINMASVLRPKLTTIKEPYYDLGAVAIRRIVKKLKKEKVEDEKTILPYRIQERESCKKI